MTRRILGLCVLAGLVATGARADVIVLKNGEMLEGRARQWGDRVLFWDRYGEEHNYHRDDLRSIQYRRLPAELAKPNLLDLTVRYIERLPRDPGFHGGAATYDSPGKKDLPVLLIDPSKYQLHRKPGDYRLDGPRGLCTADGKTAYLVTRFPVRTLRISLE